jgi:hypothetical protein
MAEARRLGKDKRGMPSAYDERRPCLVEDEEFDQRWQEGFGGRKLDSELRDEYGSVFIGRLSEFCKQAEKASRPKPWVFPLTKEQYDDMCLEIEKHGREDKTRFVRMTGSAVKNLVAGFNWNGQLVLLTYKPRPMPDSTKRHALADVSV